jgi:23S rRNA pseudouridine2605 synthase
VEELILQGRVMVNNKTVRELSTKIDSENDLVHVDGEIVSVKKHVYYLLNKPKGTITTTKDDKGRTTVVDLIKSDRSVYPIGRLDFNTTGVLLLTNDGNFSYLLSHPKHKVPREYEVKLDRELTEDDRKRLIAGVTLERKKSRFESISSPQKKNKVLLLVKCYEGRNHFVKRMFASLGYTVKSLNRCSYASLTADIPVGAYRKLSLSEINKITSHYAI